MDPITDEYMLQMLPKAKAYTAVILKPGPKAGLEGADKIKWGHGRRNFSLRAEGKLSIVCPVMSPPFVYEAYPCRSFPGDALP